MTPGCPYYSDGRCRVQDARCLVEGDAAVCPDIEDVSRERAAEWYERLYKYKEDAPDSLNG